MAQPDVHFETLPPMRVASFWGFGEQPEGIAWEKLNAWAGPRGLLGDLEAHPIFGFNNPNPSIGSTKYGYELWLCAGREMESEGDMRVVDFEGGRYAVLHCEVPVGKYEFITESWERLLAWVEDSQYQMVCKQCLERSAPFDASGIEFALDLMLPICEEG